MDVSFWKKRAVLIKGAGDLATGVALRLLRAGFRPALTDLPLPSAIRRTVCFSEALRLGRATVEGVCARAVPPEPDAILAVWEEGCVPVMADPQAQIKDRFPWQALVDVILAKRNLGTALSDAPLVIACGPGFEAGVDCHAVVETERGHNLGRVIWKGCAAPDTGVPGLVAGAGIDRLLRAPASGPVKSCLAIGEAVVRGQVVAFVGGQPMRAQISGVVRGLLPDGFLARKGMKAGDVDPRGCPEYCFSVSDKARAVAGGVLEALDGVLREKEWND